MLRTPFGRLNNSLREFEFTSTHKCPIDSEGYHIDFPLKVVMKSMTEEGPIKLASVYNGDDSNQLVYLDEETLSLVHTEAELRFQLAVLYLKTEREGPYDTTDA